MAIRIIRTALDDDTRQLIPNACPLHLKRNHIHFLRENIAVFAGLYYRVPRHDLPNVDGGHVSPINFICFMLGFQLQAASGDELRSSALEISTCGGKRCFADGIGSGMAILAYTDAFLRIMMLVAIPRIK
jgi:hypothetical protein